MEKRTNENLRNKLLVAGTAMAALLLAGCSGGSGEGESNDTSAHDRNVNERIGASPDYRFYIDFANGTQYGGTFCLDDTAYDLENYRGDSAAAEFDPATKVMTVSSDSGKLLRLTGFDNPRQLLSPADKTSENILNTYGCNFSPLIDIPVVTDLAQRR